MNVPHLVVDISGHGYGHLAQAAPVVDALRQLRPDLRITVRCALPEAVVRARLPDLDTLVDAPLDVGMVMASATTVRVADTHRAHLELHRAWPAKVGNAAEDLARLAPDLVLADVPYLSLAGAGAAGVPAVALCSLNWADVYAAYCGHLPSAAAMVAQMKAAYGTAAVFLQATPHMPMPWLARRRPIAPVTPAPAGEREDTRARLGVTDETRLLLAALGGIPTRLAVDRWPRLADALWLVPAAWGLEAPHIRPVEATGAAFSDLMAAADLVLTKPGYGTFVEAAARGTPVLYLERPDWPETPWLDAWLRGQVAVEAVPPQAAEDGALITAAARLLAAGRGPPRAFGGAAEAAGEIAAVLAK